MKRLLFTLFFLGLAPFHMATHGMHSAAALGYMPFVSAIIRNDYATVVAALNNGVNVNMQDSQGCTPLMQAAFFKRLEMAKLLLEHKADADRQDGEGFTPLMNAVHVDDVQMAALLLDYTDLNLCNMYGETAFDIAKMTWHDHIATLLATAHNKLQTLL